ALQDLIAGNVALFFDNTTSVLPFIKSNRARAIAVTSLKRIPGLDVPTMDESGFKGFNAINWTMLMGPAGTPAAIMARMEGETVKAMRSKEIVDQLTNDAVEVVASSRADAARILQSEIARWGNVIRERNIQPN